MASRVVSGRLKSISDEDELDEDEPDEDVPDEEEKADDSVLFLGGIIVVMTFFKSFVRFQSCWLRLLARKSLSYFSFLPRE